MRLTVATLAPVAAGITHNRQPHSLPTGRDPHRGAVFAGGGRRQPALQPRMGGERTTEGLRLSGSPLQTRTRFSTLDPVRARWPRSADATDSDPRRPRRIHGTQARIVVRPPTDRPRVNFCAMRCHEPGWHRLLGELRGSPVGLHIGREGFQWSATMAHGDCNARLTASGSFWITRNSVPAGPLTRRTPCSHLR